MTISKTISTIFQISLVLSLLLAACGGNGDGGDAGDSGDADAGTTTAPAEDTTANETPTTTAASSEGSSEGDPAGSETGATVTVGDETYVFALADDRGYCNPNMFDGSFLDAQLARVDEEGQAVEIDEADVPAGTEHIRISVGTDEVAQKIISGYFGGADWEAGESDDHAGDIHSITREGNRVEGTATFFNHRTEETFEGSFEVFCAGEDSDEDGASVDASGAGSEFCDDFAESIVVGLSLSDPQIDSLLLQAMAELEILRSNAPDEIASDLITVSQGVLILDEILAGHGYDLSAVPEDEFERLDDSGANEATQRVLDYCGLG